MSFSLLIRRRRSLLFVPGVRPDRFTKALESGADSVCLDLEDGVAPGGKDRAREEVTRFLEGCSVEGKQGTELVVRINSPSTEDGRQDLASFRSLAPELAPDAVIVPKAESADDLEAVLQTLAPTIPLLFPLIETPKGIHGVEELARSSRNLGALLFGGMDLAAELGAHFSWEPLLHARSRVVMAAALVGVEAMDVPYPALKDLAGLRHEALRAARLGFGGKMAIHPRQVPVLNAAFTPTDDEVERARRILVVSAAAKSGVYVVDGHMVDRPVVAAARRTLARAGVNPDEVGPEGDPPTSADPT